MNTFGDFLYSLRKKKGMTQAELAERLGVTNKAVSKWETGEAMPETSLLIPLSRIFGVSVDELLEGKRKTDYGNEETAQEYVGEDYAQPDLSRYIFTRGKDDDEEENKTVLDKICGSVCTAVMSFGIIAYLLVGMLANLWHPYWVIAPVCALSCGIICIIFDFCNAEKRKKKIAKGENLYCGGACGLIMLSCTIAYLLCGALGGLWHPLWIIMVGGAFACAVIGSICAVCDIISHKK